MDIVQAILDFNQGRDPERLRLKYAKMRQSPFIFLRGSAHLFYAQLPKAGVLRSAPPAWSCGDMHLENFGSYKGDNRLAYWDLNDFDEAALAPASWDLLRLLTSLWLAAEEMPAATAHSETLVQALLDSYAHALACGKACWVERDTAHGAARELLQSLAQRKRADFINSRTELKGRKRCLRIDGRRALAASDKQRAKVTAFMTEFAARQADPRFFEVVDVARRIAGTGSLGLDRFSILVRGKGGVDGHYLLDLKEAAPTAMGPVLRHKQPDWHSEAQRVVELQRRMQAVSMAFLQAVRMGKRDYMLRELQPTEDRLDLLALSKLPHALERSMQGMGRLLAWAQLRSAGRQGSATADELIDFGHRSKWRAKMLTLSLAVAQQVKQDAKVFAQAYDDGALHV